MRRFGLGRSKAPPRAVVLGLDGVPFTFLQRQFAAGKMPELAKLAGEGGFVQADSVQPCISCVAWASYMTGVNPGKHGIYGFQDRQAGTYDTYIANGRHIQTKTVWEVLSDRGKRVIAVNIPGTYPPRAVNGIMVGDFLAPKLEGATYPPEYAAKLAAIGYRIDVEPGLGRSEDKGPFLADLDRVFEARRRTTLSLMADEQWDVLQVHFMGTDRLNHFLYGRWEAGDPAYVPAFEAFYAKVDAMVGEVAERLDDNCALFVLSDHGFCSVQREVYLNAWLTEQGYLQRLEGDRPALKELTQQTRAYGMDPGRVYINLKGREPSGIVAPGAEYEALRDELAERLLALTCPETGERVVRAVLRPEELFHGPRAQHAPDLIAYPVEGYDLKGRLGAAEVFLRGQLSGMHTFGDAFWLLRGRALAGRPAVTDGAPTLMALVGEAPETDMDGTARVA